MRRRRSVRERQYMRQRGKGKIEGECTEWKGKRRKIDGEGLKKCRGGHGISGEAEEGRPREN